MLPLVRLDRVFKSYAEGNRSRLVLEEATAALEPGEFVALRGRSGSGKSTVLNLVAGIDSPSAGDVFLGEVCLNRISSRERTLLRRTRMGFVFQSFNLIPTLTVLENVALPMELSGAPARHAREMAAATLERVGLAGRRHSFPDRLSGGEQQRVAVARAIVHSPSLVLADEPTGNLDDHTGETVLELLDALTRRAGKTLLLATHSPSVAARADREISIQDGRLVPLRD
jgi:putative ABC transport system ATP-binding protein